MMNGYKRMILSGLLLPALIFLAGCGGNPVDPGGFTGATGGCGNFMVYKFNRSSTDAVVLTAQASALTLDRTPQEFTLPHETFDVRIEHFNGPASSNYCNDVLYSDAPKMTHSWTAVSGTVRVAAGDTLAVDTWATTYKISVSLHDVTFRDKDGEEVFVTELDFGEITVGWYPG